jgi:ubiquinone/menaquinone biosynthesis C-methylase UbiE
MRSDPLGAFGLPHDTITARPNRQAWQGTQRVNYDQIAQLYDEPSRDHGVDPNLVVFLEARTDLAPGRARLLDIGCGTGKQLAANRAAFPDGTAVGLDLFAGMLTVVRARERRIQWVQGYARRGPFRSGSFDYVTNQFSYAHIRDEAGFVREAFRVLAPGGRFVMTNIDPRGMPDWVLYQFFPEARDLDRQDFLPAESFADLMRAAGYVNLHLVRDLRPSREPVAAFLAYARRRHRTSHFIALTDDQYEAGVRRLERAVARATDSDPAVNSQFCLLTIRGDRP